MTVTSDEFVASIKRLVTMPANQVLLDDKDILAFAADKLRDTLVPEIDAVNAEFFVTKKDIPIEIDKAVYPIPQRAIGRKLRELKLVDDKQRVSDFPLINIERTQMYHLVGMPFGFHFLGDKIVCIPTPKTPGYKFEVFYGISPGKPIPVSESARITGILGGDITVDNVPEAFATGRRVDFIEGVSGHWYVDILQKIEGIVDNTISFEAGTIPESLAVGDYIALTGESPVMQIPDEGVPWLQTEVCVDVLNALSDFEGAAQASAKIKKQRDNFLKLIAPRIDGEPVIIINDRSLLRGRIRRNYAGLYRG